jgi:hypothetical protein
VVIMPNDSALHKSCHNGELDAVQRLIDGGEFDVNEGAWTGEWTRRTKLSRTGPEIMSDVSMLFIFLSPFLHHIRSGSG